MPYASELRSRARAQLGGSIFANNWLLLLAAWLVESAILGVLSFTFVGSVIVTGPLVIGLSAMQIKKVRNADSNLNFVDMFYGFTNGRFGNNIILGLLQTVFLFLWSCLFFIPGIVKSYSYAMSYYVSLDRPELGANDCITESRRLMDGKKWNLFCLDLSFLGWYIVGMLCFGVGILWVIPYHEMARANFYEELIRQPEVING